jgi:hypothetical protein
MGEEGVRDGGSQLIRTIRQQPAMRRSTDTDGVIQYKPPYKRGAVGECVVGEKSVEWRLGPSEHQVCWILSG